MHRQPKAAIRDTLLPLIELPGIVLPGKRRYYKVFSLFVEGNLPFADACHAVLMEHLGLTEIVSFYTDFDRIEGLTPHTAIKPLAYKRGTGKPLVKYWFFQS